MAELALKIGGTATYEDGDIVDAFNRRRIRHVHAQHICHVKHGRSELSEVYRAKTRQFLFQRVSKLEVVRTNLLTLAGEILSDKPNASGEYIDVPLFIARRLKHPRHGIFGPPGVERWYGGTTTATHAILDDVWAEIEGRTQYQESEPRFQQYPLSVERPAERIVLELDGRTKRRLKKLKRSKPFVVKYFGSDRQYHEAPEGTEVLAIRGGEEAREHLRVNIERDVSGEELKSLLEMQQHDLGDGRTVDKRKRAYDWREGMSSTDRARVEDKTAWVDGRELVTIELSKVIERPAPELTEVG